MAIASLAGNGARLHEWLTCVDIEILSMSPARILIVEDFADSRDMYVEFLTANGFEVSAAEDGIQALHSIEQSSPDVVVLDIALPRLDGLSVLKRLRADERFAGLPVLTLSASLGADYQRLAKAAGATEALEKPCLPDELLAAVEKALKAPR